MTIRRLVERPAPLQLAVTRAGPVCALRGTSQVQVATDEFATTSGSPFCLEPPLYRTEREHLAPDGRTVYTTDGGILLAWDVERLRAMGVEGDLHTRPRATSDG